ncbi:hypothetical protein [Longimicrobium sp.]|uniref:hypothetical protein n=1 Tax=Longimicrobium sp. TaxID=2029185 RepID=UPI002BE7CEAF|nr:hypothetical protein [Longimicrobium sp.]HSU12499.1 hypothetical protein [Longimicrobium sp.]
MPFTLNLGFAGMCLFVPEPSAAKPDTMHVLLPNTEGHGMEMGAEMHFAAFIYDPACEVENNAAPGGVVKNPEVIEIEHTLLDLTKLSASTTTVLEVPPGAANFGTLVKRKVDKRHFRDAKPGGQVVSRISFSKGRACVPDNAKGGIWKLAGVSGQQLPIRVVYEIKVDGTYLDLDFQGLNKHPKKRKLRLYPDKDNVLNVWIFHAPEDQLPAELPPPVSKKTTIGINDENPHFAAFYNIVGVDLPILESFPAMSPAPSAESGGGEQSDAGGMVGDEHIGAMSGGDHPAAEDAGAGLLTPQAAAAAASGSEVTCVIALAETR